MFIDEVTLHLKAGKGGDGVVRWRHEKGKDSGGPSGGNGGKGGDIIALATRDIGALLSYRNIKNFEAPPGGDGFKDTKQGGEGKDIILNFPIGSKITNEETGYSVELLNDGEQVILLKGGRGGLGNDHFKSSINVAPKESTDGALGEEADFKVELLLVVDLGLIGLPNAGKSSLLNSLTRARSKVGDFPFTTIEPSLGNLYGLILADIPGLIEGAAEGRGLGHKFLRHIRRTKALIHCISAEVEDPLEAYKIVRKELELYNKEILSKPEVILLTKVDLLTDKEIKERLSVLKKASKTAASVAAVSIIDEKLLNELSDNLTQNFK